MLGRALAHINRLLVTSGRPPIHTSARTSPLLKFRPTLESLDVRDVPAAFTWTGAVSTDATNPANWSDNNPGSLPGAGDDLYFVPTLTVGGPTSGTIGSSPPPGSAGSGAPVDCYGLTSSSGSFNSITIESGYTATVTLATAITVNGYEQDDGVLAQPGTDLTVLSSFLWTSGTLNNTTTTANVNLYGSGSITPASAGTVTLGSTLNLYGTDTQPTTLTVNPGTIALTDSSCGMNINANAETDVVEASATATFSLTGGSSTNQQVKVAAKGTLTMTGSGNSMTDNTVSIAVPVNNSGTVVLSGQVGVTMKGGTANANPAAYDYTQVAGSKLQVENGSGVTTPRGGMDVQGGIVLLTMNANLPAGSQIAYFSGNLTFEGGAIQFTGPLMIGTARVYGTLNVAGDVTWSGGTYQPWVDYTPVSVLPNNLWLITGTLTLPANNTAAITPVATNVPGNGKPPAAMSWNILNAKKVANANVPTVNVDAKGNQLTLKTAVAPDGSTKWTLNS